jgi:hypothetical protein
LSENGSLREVGGDSDDDSEGPDINIHGMNEEDAGEDWEHELDEAVQRPPAEIKDWGVLQTQIKQDLKKRSKTLPLSAINQLMILSNFATLRLKGVSRITASEEIAQQWHDGEGKYFARRVRALARHYRNFEQLPVERRGGHKNVRSLLKDENVKKRALSYLQSLPTGKVTLKKLQVALNTIILPDHNKEASVSANSSPMVNQIGMAPHTCEEGCLHGWTRAGRCGGISTEHFPPRDGRV